MTAANDTGRRSEIKAGALLNYAVIFLNNLVGLAYTPYMIRMLGQSEFGIYSMVASAIAYLTVLDFGFTNAVIRYTARFRAEGKQREQYEMFGMFIVIYSAIALVAVAAGGVLYANLDSLFGGSMTPVEIDKARPMLVMLLLNLAVTFPMSVFTSVATAYESFIFQKVMVILRILLSTAVMIVLLHAGYKAMALVVVQTVFNVALLTANCVFCFRKLHIKVIFGKFRPGLLKEVSLYSFWILLNTVMDRIYWSTGQFILGAVSGTVAVAVFAVAIRIEQMYMSFSTAISSVFLPKVTAMVASGSSDREISDLFIRTGRIQYAVLIFALTGFFLFGREFVLLWAGMEYGESYLLTLVFLVPLTVPLIQNLGITVLQARNRMKFRSLVYIAIAAVSFVMQVVLSRSMGALGCALAVSGGLVAGQIVIMNIYYSKVQKIDIAAFWREIGKMSVMPLSLAAVTFFVIRDLDLLSVSSLAAAIAVYSAVYLPLFWFTSMNRSEKRLVSGLVRKIVRR